MRFAFNARIRYKYMNNADVLILRTQAYDTQAMWQK